MENRPNMHNSMNLKKKKKKPGRMDKRQFYGSYWMARPLVFFLLDFFFSPPQYSTIGMMEGEKQIVNKGSLTLPTSTGSGPVYSSITKNWFQTQPLLERCSTCPSLPFSWCPWSEGRRWLLRSAVKAWLWHSMPRHTRAACKQ